MWRFCAYKSEQDYNDKRHYFKKYFFNHVKMKLFSGEHSAKEKLSYPDYVSNYWKIENVMIKLIEIVFVAILCVIPVNYLTIYLLKLKLFSVFNFIPLLLPFWAGMIYLLYFQKRFTKKERKN